jgi:hypothetical protein
MQPAFNIRITLGVIVALAVATTVLHSLVFLSIQPASLSAAMPISIASGRGHLGTLGEPRPAITVQISRTPRPEIIGNN